MADGAESQACLGISFERLHLNGTRRRAYMDDLLFDAENLSDGRVLDANWDVIAEQTFVEHHACGDPA
jgi:hypothetical protein